MVRMGVGVQKDLKPGESHVFCCSHEEKVILTTSAMEAAAGSVSLIAYGRCLA